MQKPNNVEPNDTINRTQTRIQANQKNRPFLSVNTSINQS